MKTWTNYYWEMKTLYDSIYNIMQNIPDTRNIKHDEFITNLRSCGCSNSSESITRARRKVWQDHPELKPNNAKYKIHKTQKEIGMRSWATLD